MQSNRRLAVDGAVISDVPLFSGLARADLDDAVRAAHSRRLAKGDALFRQDQAADGFYVLLHGELKVAQTTPDGQQIVLRYVGPGEFLGCAAITGRAAYPGTAVAVVDSVVLSWSGAAAGLLVRRYPQMALNVLGGVAGHLHDAHARLRELATERVERRVARTLLRLARQSGERIAEGVEIRFPVSRQDVAEMTGTTLHTVSRILSAWESEGMLASGRQKIVVLAPHRLVAIAEDLIDDAPSRPSRVRRVA